MPLISVSLVCCICGRYSCYFSSPSHNCASKGENEQFHILRYQGVVLLLAGYFSFYPVQYTTSWILQSFEGKDISTGDTGSVTTEACGDLLT